MLKAEALKQLGDAKFILALIATAHRPRVRKFLDGAQVDICIECDKVFPCKTIETVRKFKYGTE